MTNTEAFNFSSQTRLPLGIPIKTAIIESGKRAGDDGKRQKAGSSAI